MTHPLSAEIRDAIAAAAGGREPSTDSTFNKPGDEWVSYGLRAPVYYAAIRGFRPRIAVAVLALSARDLTPAHFAALDRMADDFRGWSHVDDFCITVVQPLLDRHPQKTIAQLERWSHSPDRWKRRTSVVAFVRKTGESGRYTDTVLALADRLAFDPEDLVQKGVGWALKDNMRGSPERILAFVKDLRRRGAPATVTLYAIRDLKGAARAEVLAVKADRQ
jgi:3-methyladenine DNA glycosylase AlkD